MDCDFIHGKDLKAHVFYPSLNFYLLFILFCCSFIHFIYILFLIVWTKYLIHSFIHSSQKDWSTWMQLLNCVNLITFLGVSYDLVNTNVVLVLGGYWIKVILWEQWTLNLMSVTFAGPMCGTDGMSIIRQRLGCTNITVYFQLFCAQKAAGVYPWSRMLPFKNHEAKINHVIDVWYKHLIYVNIKH